MLVARPVQYVCDLYTQLAKDGLISMVMSLVLDHVVHEFTVTQEWVHVL